MVIPYAAGMSEDIRCVCRKFNITVFKSGWTLRSMLTKAKDGRGQELLVKEALHIQMTPSEECFNRDGGLEVPGCWTSDEEAGREEQSSPTLS